MLGIILNAIIPSRRRNLIRQLEESLAKVKRLAEDSQNQAKTYTTITTFYGRDEEFWTWAKQIHASSQYRYMIFQLRENIIRLMSGEYDSAKLVELNGRLNMLDIIDNYLAKGVSEYELQRDQKNTAG
jgi:hypothetical protein